ncbi:MAG: phosphoenolpyruvate--protein phosphotransferase [Moraxellaceae bacterium]|nr:phosphoenolpyruvate--protein phosphotransferase [Moraxellaceae bacterium]MBP9730440.1 phosphoenolpyruvate--protein phosphotransferase [Moraxellaceae bacterium]
MLLDMLRKIVQDVDSAPNFTAALDTMVTSVRESMGTEVCSVYLLDDKTNRYVLMASEGLNPDAIGTVSLAWNEGLVGLCGAREEPINLDNAASHPKYRYLPETGEEKYNSFLGAPIMHRRKVLGVLVVQQLSNRRFDESEEAFLVTLSAQLSGVVAHAKAIGSLEVSRTTPRSNMTRIFNGIAGATGIVLGRAMVMYPPADIDSVPDRLGEDSTTEIELLQQAVVAVRLDISQLNEKMANSLMPEERALFDVYLRMLDDNALPAEVIERITAGNWAQGALREVIEQHMQTFSFMDDPYLRERMADVRDLGLRILAHLQKQEEWAPREFPDHAILVGDEITTAMLVETPLEKIAGIVTVTGAANSHMAIVARALGIPTVVGVSDLPVTQLDDNELIVDAYQGRIFVQPSRQLRARYKEIIKEERQLVAGLEAYKNLPTITPDDHRIALYVNTGLMADVARGKTRGAEGVGLYRSEIPFMLRERFPSEEEQRAIYRQQLEAFAPAPVTMRTLDIGGDKDLPYFPIKEDNPFLGWRGIRITLDHPEIFMVQIRAMLKAAIGLDNLQVLLPMISSVFEIEEALHLIHRAVMEVEEEEGVPIVMPKVGVMVEVPATVFQIADMAQLIDFVSVGSNDLTQYMLAVDRNNTRVADIYTPYHPSVLRALQIVVDEVHRVGKPVGICGEMAGDPATAVLLMAMGFDSLSMSASNLLRVRKTLRTVPLAQAKSLLDQVMQVDNAAVIKSMVEFELDDFDLMDLIRPKNKA